MRHLLGVTASTVVQLPAYATPLNPYAGSSILFSSNKRLKKDQIMTFPSFTHPILALLLLLSISIIPISGLPTIAIVPGAWQSPIHYTKLTTLLRAEGYTVISHPNPSVDSLLPSLRTAAGDAADIYRYILLPLIVQEGEDVVLVMHGYGGLVGSAAAGFGGLSRVERRGRGLPGGIIGMIFIAAFVSRDGGSMAGLLPGGELEEWVLQYVRAYAPEKAMAHSLTPLIISPITKPSRPPTPPIFSTTTLPTTRTSPPSSPTNCATNPSIP